MKYIINVDRFDISCRTSTFNPQTLTKGKKGKPRLDRVLYAPTTVPVKAVHLIRNPFFIMISRMHMWRKNHKTSLSTNANDKADFDEYCEVIHQPWRGREDEELFPDSIIELFTKNVPCYADWFRYVQWHNNANEVIRQRHLPVLVLMYEAYTTDYNRTVNTLFDFLKLDKKGKSVPFVVGKEYSSYYSEEVSIAASRLVRALATPQTWGQIKHYCQERWI
jgi:hypothetical protein